MDLHLLLCQCWLPAYHASTVITEAIKESFGAMQLALQGAQLSGMRHDQAVAAAVPPSQQVTFMLKAKFVHGARDSSIAKAAARYLCTSARYQHASVIITIIVIIDVCVHLRLHCIVTAV